MTLAKVPPRFSLNHAGLPPVRAQKALTTLRVLNGKTPANEGLARVEAAA